jgi:hypothetical protein
MIAQRGTIETDVTDVFYVLINPCWQPLLSFSKREREREREGL